MPAAEKPRVLLAENDTGIAGLIELALGQRGFDVEVVADGLAAVRAVATGNVDLLVTDLEMPTLAGEQLVALLAGDRNAAVGVALPDEVLAAAVAQATPILVISAYLNDSLTAEISARRNVRGTWRKPFDLFEFADAVQTAIGRNDRDSAEPS